jgi:bacterial/archaeal transporter family protein
MHWIVASVLSALCLGFYDLSNKHALRENAVVPVIFFSTVASSIVWASLIVFNAFTPGVLPAGLQVDELTGFQHLQIFAKSSIVGLSWMFTYFGIKHLPLSIAAPIRATSPLWTLLGAVILLHERPSALETVGIVTTLGSFLGLSLVGSREGIHFHRNKWIWFMVLGTLCGAISSLYDKFLLGSQGFRVPTVQAWFSFYLVAVFLPLVIGWKRRWWPRNEFHWRWSIPMIGLILLVSDYLYFSALKDTEALVSLVASIRRGSTLVAFAGGLWIFGEKNGLKKLPAVLGVLIGIILTILG